MNSDRVNELKCNSSHLLQTPLIKANCCNLLCKYFVRNELVPLEPSVSDTYESLPLQIHERWEHLTSFLFSKYIISTHAEAFGAQAEKGQIISGTVHELLQCSANAPNSYEWLQLANVKIIFNKRVQRTQSLETRETNRVSILLHVNTKNANITGNQKVICVWGN